MGQRPGLSAFLTNLDPKRVALMTVKERIIVALDVDSLEKARPLVVELADSVGCFKIGLELLTAVGAPQAVGYVRSLGGDVFLDGKFKDIPNTIAGAVRAAVQLGVRMFNLHCDSGPEAMRTARRVVDELIPEGDRPLVLGVTLLTSLDYSDLVKMRICKEWNIADPQEKKELEEGMVGGYVKNLAWLAQECGLDGVIASPREIQAIRGYCQPNFLVITPGVRPEWAAVGDQKRVMTPAEAIKAGADALVIGRPITQPPAEIGGPVEAVKLIADEIAGAL